MCVCVCVCVCVCEHGCVCKNIHHKMNVYVYVCVHLVETLWQPNLIPHTDLK